MRGSSGQIKLTGLRTICCVLAILLGGMTWGPSGTAWGKTDGWLGWLFDLFAADDVPRRPDLVDDDRAATDNTMTLLGSYPDSAARSLILGVFWAARGDAPQAEEHFRRARELDSSKSLLPLTMAAQTYMQVGDYRKAKSLHEEIVKELQTTSRRERGRGAGGSRDSSLMLQRVNAYLDLAVACSKLNEPNEAMEYAQGAKNLLSLSSRDRNDVPVGQVAFGYLRLGSVYGDSLGNVGAARDAWQEGRKQSGEGPGLVKPRTIVELNLKMIESSAKDVPDTSLDEYLAGAERAMKQLDGESQLAVQTRLGMEFAKLAIDRRDVPEASLRCANRARTLLRRAGDLSPKDARSTEELVLKVRAINAQTELPDFRENTEESARLKEERQTAETYLMAGQFTPHIEFAPK
jgi:tetratricopeptide (TPR) repeat protein